MTFNTPTTKTELDTVLKQIDDYYRYRQDAYDEPEIVPLNLQRIEFTPKTDEEITLMALELFNNKKAQEKSQKEAEINADIIVLEAEKNSIGGGYTLKINEIDNNYNESLKKLETEVAERNMSYSSAYYKAISLIEEKRNAEKIKLSTEIQEKSGLIDGKISAKLSLMNSLDETLTCKYDALMFEYINEYKEKQREIEFSVLKYNNQVDEKMIKNENSVNQSFSRLKLDYLAIVNEGLTTEQLDSLGYYRDVISAIDAYYYSISAEEAYNDFSLDSKMTHYLGDYYDDILYKYKLRADKA